MEDIHPDVPTVKLIRFRKDHSWKAFAIIFVVVLSLVGLAVFALRFVVDQISEGLGGGISTPSFLGSWVVWVSVIGMIAVIGALSYYLKKETKEKKEEKPSAAKAVVEVKKEAPKNKKDEGFQFLHGIGLVLYWPAWITLYIVLSNGAYTLLRPYITYEALSNVELREMIYFVLGILFLAQCRSLIDVKKKGPRPLAFAVAWGIIAVGIPMLMFQTIAHWDFVQYVWSKVLCWF